MSLVAVVALGVLFPAAGHAAAQPEEPLEYGWTPSDLHAAYQLPFETPSASAETPPSQQQTVALLELGGYPTAEKDLGVFSQTFGLPACTAASGCLQVINEEGNAQPLPPEDPRAGETSMDIEMVHAICPTCHIVIVEGPLKPGVQDLTTIGEEVNAAVEAGATEVSISIELYAGASEAEETAYLEELEANYFEHNGVVITAAAGDCGYDHEAGLNGHDEIGFCPRKKEGASFYPGYPSKLLRVISVGGTMLAEIDGVWDSRAWTNGGSGCAHEIVTPPWQAKVPNWSEAGCTGRTIADVSAAASCEPGVAVYDTTEVGEEGHGWGNGCGTSSASPIVAAEFALAGGARGRARPAQTLYEHAGQSSAFFDVVEGSDGVCVRAIECEAQPGYDEPTGLGSPVGLYAFSLRGAPMSESPPVISGAAQVGKTLAVEGGAWKGLPETTFDEWQVCDGLGLGCFPIMGATGPTYTVPETDLGKTIRVVETAGNVDGYSPPAVSVPTRPVTVAAPGSGTQPSPAAGSPLPPPGRKASALPRISRRRLVLRGRGYVPVMLHCPSAATGGCKGALTIGTAGGGRGSRKLGQASYEARAGQTLHLRVHLAGFARTLLERRRSIRATVTVADFRAGGSTSRRVSVRLGLPRHHARRSS